MVVFTTHFFRLTTVGITDGAMIHFTPPFIQAVFTTLIMATIDLVTITTIPIIAITVMADTKEAMQDLVTITAETETVLRHNATIAMAAGKPMAEAEKTILAATTTTATPDLL